jgi:DNA-binding transcriptional MocR family regulator
VATSSRSLRRLVPDPELFDRFLAGESSRSLGRDYHVAHTTILRAMRRPEAAEELRAARQRLREQQQARAAERREKREAQADVRRRACEEARLDRELEAWYRSAKTRAWASEYEVWLDQRDAPRYLSSKERVNTHGELAEKVVSAGGGVDEVIEVTGLRTWQNVYRLINPQVLVRALANSRGRRPSQLPPQGFRRLRPDAALITRRAAGATLRTLADDYGVAHTTLSRYFRRPTIAKELRSQRRKLAKQRRREPGGDKTVIAAG